MIYYIEPSDHLPRPLCNNFFFADDVKLFGMVPKKLETVQVCCTYKILMSHGIFRFRGKYM